MWLIEDCFACIINKTKQTYIILLIFHSWLFKVLKFFIFFLYFFLSTQRWLTLIIAIIIEISYTITVTLKNVFENHVWDCCIDNTLRNIISMQHLSYSCQKLLLRNYKSNLLKNTASKHLWPFREMKLNWIFLFLLMFSIAFYVLCFNSVYCLILAASTTKRNEAPFLWSE